MELYWSKEVIPDGNSHEQVEMKSTRNSKYVVNVNNYKYIFSF
jgi:hypothetical protein